MLARVVILLALGLMPGCAYLSDRGRDLGQCFLGDVQFGGGLSAAAKVGPARLIDNLVLEVSS